MEWHKCSKCGGGHPWRDGEKPCPNERLVTKRIEPDRRPSAGVVGVTGSTFTPMTVVGGNADVAAVVRRGRPRLEDRQYTLAVKRPWQAVGMSRTTWYSRRREKREGE